jgi:dipeptidyl aminopeptidase/acylaminoacyl peptidase
MKDTAPYGTWPSSISADSVVAGVVGLAELRRRADTLFWLESRPGEGGRSVLMSRAADGQRRELTPAPFNVRSRVHEYGGGAYTFDEDNVFFVNFSDQNLYQISPDGEIRQITHSDADERFADFCVDTARGRLLSVIERHHPDAEPSNALAAVDINSGEVRIVSEGYDFYAAPRLDSSGNRIAFIAWSHPNMPWDGSLLLCADMNDTGALKAVTQVAGGAVESVTQPSWQADGSLIYISDANGFYNLYCYDDAGNHCLLQDAADYAHPAWVFGQCEYTPLDEQHLAAIRQTEAGQELVLINRRTGMASPIAGEAEPWRRFDSLTARGSCLYFIAGFSDRTPAVEELNIKSRASVHLLEAGGEAITAAVSSAEALQFPTRDGACAYGYFYAPCSHDCKGPDAEKPPLLVMSHGGPTAATDPSLNMRIQYYTSRGWAVLDVNYRGSSGFGRDYRCALNGRWGELDVWDCEDGVRFLSNQQRIDPARVAIRGGSAGGYTTLAALTTTSTFRCGASHYGIGDLRALVADTHKFESRYMYTMLESEENLHDRSPINHLDGLSCPVIFFQGGADKVVPPNQAEAMVAALRSKKIPVAYLLFPEEGHGFRAAENIVRALECEFAFFSIMFGIKPADELPELDIMNYPPAAGVRE